MEITEKGVCPICGGSFRFRDMTPRYVRTKGGERTKIKIRRLRCTICGYQHRELPDTLLPYKQYEKEIISGVVNGYITPTTLGYEDYPSEVTMKRWIEEFDKME